MAFESKTAEPRPVLEARGLTKRFPGARALANVDFRLFAGEVHALMGQNGAGKSTLVKVLTGVCGADAGQILLDGREIRPASPLDAQRLGISVVYQEVNLCANLSVAENIFLGHPGMTAFAIRWRDLQRRAAVLLDELEVHIDVTAPLGDYSVAVQQMVAIARALSRGLTGDRAAQAQRSDRGGTRILILDEPTSSLAEGEVKMLFSVIRALRAQGLAILFITHFLDQAFAIADRFTVLRNGQRVDEYPVAQLTPVDLIVKMVGREIAEALPEPAGAAPSASAASGDEPPPLLTARGLGRRADVTGIDLVIRPGEVVGFAGLLGSGRSETARLLFGSDRADQGTLEIDGQAVRFTSPRDAIVRGLGYCPEDRKAEGIIGELSLRENIILALQSKRGILRSLPRARQDEIARGYIQLLGIKAADADVPIARLSGGNQQKALLARWLATDPRMLILDEPTRGIDIAAKLEIMAEVVRLCDKGMAIVFISSEMAEVLRYSNRIVVLRNRTKVAELVAGEADEHKVFQIIAGGVA